MITAAELKDIAGDLAEDAISARIDSQKGRGCNTEERKAFRILARQREVAAYACRQMAKAKAQKDKEGTKPFVFDLTSFIRDQIEFSAATFGPPDGRNSAGCIDHIRKELLEIEAKPDDLEEWIDVILLAIDGAWRQGGTPETITATLAAKLEKNKARKWPDWRTAERGKAITHIKEETP